MGSARQAAAVILGGLAVASGPALAGSAGASTAPKPSKVLAQAIQNLSKAPTITFSGVINQGKQHVRFSVRSADHGARSAATMSIGSEAFSFVHIGSKLYLRANAPFWVANGGGLPTSVVKALVPHWVILPPADGKGIVQAFGPLSDPKTMASHLFGGKPAGIRFAGFSTVGGVRVRKLVDVKGDKAAAYVTRTGKVLPVEILDTAKASGGVVRFGYPASLTIKAPSGAKTLQQLVSTAAKQG